MANWTLKVVAILAIFSINELANQKQRIDDLENTLSQINTQNEQIIELENNITQLRDEIEETTLSLTNLAGNYDALNQSTSQQLFEIETSIQNLENIMSQLSNMEEIIDQLNDFTPADVYEIAYRSVVVIRTSIGQGSGFLFNNSNQNLIATNYHVVEDETNIEIEFFDKTRTQATIIGSDAYSDVAIISVSTVPAMASFLNFGDQPSIGQQVVAIGNPLGLTESLSVGYISQVNRTLDIEPIIVPILQLDLTIAPGSSGGPLLDLSGNVVGITNAGTEVGFNFAVPVNILNRVIPALIQNGTYDHPFIGIYPLALTPEVVFSLNILNVDPFQTGLLILNIVPDSPASEAGLKAAINGTQGLTASDIILAINGNPTYIEEDLTAYMEVEVSPTEIISLTVWRSGVTDLVTITTTTRPPYVG
ncbi:MAG: trypsin-like peptidase domain-containing protein [Candidatus Bathyarchaeota archaeon]